MKLPVLHKRSTLCWDVLVGVLLSGWRGFATPKSKIITKRPLHERNQFPHVVTKSWGTIVRHEIGHKKEQTEPTMTAHFDASRMGKMSLPGSIPANALTSMCADHHHCTAGEFCSDNHTCKPCRECNVGNPKNSITSDCDTCAKTCSSHGYCAWGLFCHLDGICKPCSDWLIGDLSFQHLNGRKYAIDGNSTVCDRFCSKNAHCGTAQFCDERNLCQECIDCDVKHVSLSGNCSTCSGDSYACDVHEHCGVAEFCGIDRTCHLCSECTSSHPSSASVECAGCGAVT